MQAARRCNIVHISHFPQLNALLSRFCSTSSLVLTAADAAPPSASSSATAYPVCAPPPSWPIVASSSHSYPAWARMSCAAFSLPFRLQILFGGKFRSRTFNSVFSQRFRSRPTLDAIYFSQFFRRPSRILPFQEPIESKRAGCLLQL